ncbi:flagellar hook protein FlgE [Benzoatithermus flavus]|uniref:Flagellar hook protein FlgE n=1 Tax=Benzoatithermus flavus TaxID=3108223 RepID=A0ABU8XQA4_9PROT
MSLFGSLFSGVSGLNAQSRAMSMISDNVANVNTTAFKGADVQFASLVTRQRGAVSTYSPGGVRAQSHYTVTSQGLIQSSASPTDAAISGAGFFVVNTLPRGDGEQLYTRAGSFEPDFEGKLRTASGQYLQGWALDADEKVADVNRLETVNIRRINGFAVATTTVEVGANLDADEAPYAGAYAAGDMAAWQASGGASGVKPSFTRPVQIYDSLGRAHDVTLAFLRTGAANSWAVELCADPAAVDATVHADGLLASGTVTFSGTGTLASADLTPVVSGTAGTPVEIRWARPDGADPSRITFDFGTIGGTDGLSQFASPTNVAFVRQNGAPVGELNGAAIDENGFVVASFTNGETRRLYQLPIATFANPSGLDPRSGNVFGQTDVSGEFNLRLPGRGGAGTITPSALESANVDLAEEFTKMIVTQRAYSANAKVINAADQMLDELIRVAG